MRTGLMLVIIMLLADCTTRNPPPAETPGSAMSAAQPSETETTSEGVIIDPPPPPPPPPKKVVYVIDLSASMSDTVPYLKHELKRSIRSLRPSDSFWVTFFSSGPTLDLPTGKHKMLPATVPNKEKAYDFIDSIVASGQADPAEAIKKAFDCQPDRIYIVTDGDFEPGIADLIVKLNPKKEVMVNTISFIHSKGEPLLRKIAEENEGTYHFVNEEDVKMLMTK